MEREILETKDPKEILVKMAKMVAEVQKEILEHLDLLVCPEDLAEMEFLALLGHQGLWLKGRKSQGRLVLMDKMECLDNLEYLGLKENKGQEEIKEEMVHQENLEEEGHQDLQGRKDQWEPLVFLDLLELKEVEETLVNQECLDRKEHLV